MTFSGIKSKPVYSPLRADLRGRAHILVGMGSGGTALTRVQGEFERGSVELQSVSRVLFVPGGTSGAFSATGAEVRLFDHTSELLTALRSVLDESVMGTRLYVAGPESFIGLVLKLALQFDLNKDEIRAEESGSAARRVYCIHCRATLENVETNITHCTNCDRWLLVRDHYSRRLAAYMGVMVDAEVPGERPPVEKIFV